MSALRSNLIIAGVVVVAIAAYTGYVRTKWNRMESQGGIRSLMTGSVSAPSIRSEASDFKARIPDWIPLYPGTVPEGMSSSQAGIEHYIDVRMRTHDHCTKVGDWYEKKLMAAGYTIHQRFDYEDPACTSTLSLDGPHFTRSISVDASGSTTDVRISLRAVERKVSGGATPAIPKWVPLYPGAAPPPHLDARMENDGHYRLTFSFSTADDPAKVYDWYQAQLKKIGFSAKFETTPRSAGHFTSQTRDNRRTVNMQNFPGPPENEFVVDVTER